MWHAYIRPQPASRNGIAENLATNARASSAPNDSVRLGPGLSAHNTPAYAAAPHIAVKAISVVISPEWASTGGRVVNSSVAINAAIGPAPRFAYRKTTTEAIQKKGRMPRRPRVRIR